MRSPVGLFFRWIGYLVLTIIAIILILPILLKILGFALKAIFVAVGVIAIIILILVLIIAITGLVWYLRNRSKWQDAQTKGEPFEFGGRNFKFHVNGQDVFYDQETGRKDITPDDKK
ncbi:hypothetical protein [Weissella soli]|uniref:hypothetical protein n=1 Tax=Weissella soli TaxID=155866 RepID=UPI00359FFA65